MNIIQAINDKRLFGKWFKNPDSWKAWFACLSAMFALQDSEDYLSFYKSHTGRTEWPTTPAKEAWLIVGRRGGKSLIASLTALYLTAFKDYSAYLAPGEIATAMVIATDRAQARVIMRYVNGFIDNIPMLAKMVKRRTEETIEFNNRTAIEVHSCSFRSVRGYTLCAVVADEIAFWRADDSANPDKEILAAVRPGLATIPGSMLIGISSPYARRGALYEAHKKHFGKDGDPVFVWNAPSLDMNPSLSPDVVAQAMEDDESSAKAEYLAQFRTDIESLIDRETINALVVPGRIGLPPVPRISYYAFVDPSGGSADSMTLAICHEANGKVIIDTLLEKKPPFSPEDTVREFAGTLQAFGISEVVGDRYAGEWPREQFRKYGITYETSEKNKSELYQAMLPVMNSGRVELPDNKRLISQLIGLERRTARGGRDTIDHAPHSHDDLANAVAGAIAEATRERATVKVVKLLY